MNLVKSLIAMTAITAISVSGFAAGAKKSAAKTNTAAQTLPATGQVQWTGTGIGKAHTGTVQVKNGTVELKGTKVTGGTFELDMNTIAWQGDERLVKHLKSPDFFDVEKFPTGKFVITKMEPIAKAKAGEPNYKVSGMLTIRDKTEPVSFDAIVAETAGEWSAKGDLTIPDRTKFGITYNSKKFFDLTKLGEKLINDEIKIALDVKTAKK